MAYAVVARYVCAAEDADAVRTALLEMRARTRDEPANLDYVVHEEQAEGDDVAFLLYEQYVDRAGFEAHTQTPHFSQHIAGFVRPRLRDRTVFFADVI